MTVYFDNAATTAVCAEAAETALRVMTECYGNPSSTHHMGREAKRYLTEARVSVAKAMGCDPKDIYFTSGGTEADNWAIFGAAKLMRHQGRHIITTAAEHDAVLRPLRQLEAQGWEITYLTPGKDGSVTAEQVADALRDDTVLVTVMLVNNEVGAINPIREISNVLKRSRSEALLHTDAVQAFCKLPFTPKELGADLVTVSSHKIHGPKGAGALYIKSGLRLPPIVFGGGQERSMRPGTEAMPAICGFGTASELASGALKSDPEMFRRLNEHTVSRLGVLVPEAVIIGGGADHILSLSLPGYKSEVVMNLLDSEGICVSKSSACKKGARSHVLEAMGLNNRVIDGAIRVSFSRYSTVEEIDYFAEKLADAAKRLIRV